MSTRLLQGPPGYGEEITAPVLVSAHGFSARYDVDHETGIISRPTHDLYGQSIAEKILVFPSAKGGTATGWRLWDLVERGVGPVGLIFRETNPVMVQAAVLASVPIMHRLQPDPIAALDSGQVVRIRPRSGTAEVLQSSH
jgi:uncharacterized protein